MKQSSAAAKPRQGRREAASAPGKKRTKLPTADEVLASLVPGEPLPGMSTGERWQIIEPVVPHLSKDQQALYLYLHATLNAERGDDQHSLSGLAKKMGWWDSALKK